MPTLRVPRAGVARRATLAIYFGAVVAAGALIVGWAAPRAWEFVGAAPREFWLITFLAAFADSRPFVRPRQSRWPSRTILSICFTFAIFLLWGAAAAIVVQVVAVAVAALRLRLPPADWAFLTARLVCAFGAAEAVVRATGLRPEIAIGAGIDRFDVYTVFVPAASWLVVDYGLVIFAQLAAGLGAVRGLTIALWYDFLASAALVLLAPALVAAPTGWSLALIAIPLLALGQYSRLFADQERRLNHDPVTGVLSRRGLVASLAELTSADELDPTRPRPVALMLANLEGLTYINRDLGRELAEKVVTEAARRMRDAVGEDGQVGRISGDVFVILLPDVPEGRALDSASVVAAVLGRPIEVDGLPFVLDPTVGVALSPQHGRDFSTLVGKAETSAVEARARGETARVYTQEELDATRARVAILGELRSALRDPDRSAEIAMRYQPQVDVGSGRVVGVEALLRWTHPRWGPVRADELIQAAEPSEVMQLLTRRVIGDVAAQLAAWNEAGIELRASVNVSVRDLYTEGFVEQLRSILDRHAVRPAQFQIEITEGMVVADSARLVRAARSLTAMGVRLSLDDFGTGYASLQQLRLLPLAEVKIDRSYVGRMSMGGPERAIVNAVYQLAQALDVRVVAEGVEDARTVALLADMPGVLGQGWYFGQPMLPAELVEWLRSREDAATSRRSER